MQGALAVREDYASPAAAVASPSADAEHALRQGASVEAMPRELAATDVAGLLPLGTEVYVPAPSGAQWADTLAACRALRLQGMVPVPHLTARDLASAAELSARLEALREHGVGALLLIAGDAARPKGPFANTLAVLDSGQLMRWGLRDLRVAVHPEGHPRADESSLASAFAAKIAYAKETATRLLLVSQFAFAASSVLPWWQRIACRDDCPPLCVGVPGPASLGKALAYAARCGVGASARALARRPALGRLARAWRPDEMVAALAAYGTGPGEGNGANASRAGGAAGQLAGIHVFCFGGLAATVRWLRGPATATRHHR